MDIDFLSELGVAKIPKLLSFQLEKAAEVYLFYSASRWNKDSKEN